ncbi:MAG: glutamine--tRNA ligase [Candidatus Lightella neohaematopini]|nr:glutamine--tRNA ligase [Candidatus Lightella neohaematopini]
MKDFSKNNFIYNIINNDILKNKYRIIHTRFSPEPNGYLHIGHIKSIYLNFSIAINYNGKFNLRFDDTNPDNEKLKFINSIIDDIKWLGCLYYKKIFYASNYFFQMYNYAIELINKNLAYVDLLSKEEIKIYRGTLTKPGIDSPYRNQSKKNNLILFKKMRFGKFNQGTACLRAKIDMKSPCLIMRDPVLYRIKYVNHHQTNNDWCIYPTYDFAHCISDAIEGITHSLCTSEFIENRKLYNWILKNISINHYPKQYEFAPLNLSYHVLSKRKLKVLVDKKIVNGWDDPRMPTIAGLRRRGYTAKSLIEFCKRIGVTKKNSLINIKLLEHCINKELNTIVPRIMAIINPILLIINSLPKNYCMNISVPNHPNNPNMGKKNIILTREIYIDRTDFNEFYTKNFKKLTLFKKVKLRYSYVIKAYKILKKNNKIVAILCNHERYRTDKAYKSKISIIHWVSKKYSLPAEFRLYENLFKVSNIEDKVNFTSYINKNSLIVKHGFIEKNIKVNLNIDAFQFEREGYFCLDKKYINDKIMVFNRITSIKHN